MLARLPGTTSAAALITAGAVVGWAAARFSARDAAHAAADASVAEDEDSDGEDDVACKQWGLQDAPYKMVLCVNTDLKDATGKKCKMTSGKTAAQCCHACLGAYKRAVRQSPSAVKWWQRTGQAKVAVKVPVQAELETLAAAAEAAGLCCYLVEDAGRTQIAPGSKTVLAIGPAPVHAFEGITGHLKLY